MQHRCSVTSIRAITSRRASASCCRPARSRGPAWWCSGWRLATYVLWHIHEVIFLLFLGILLATAIEPIVNYLRRGPFGKGSGVLVVYTAIVLVLGTMTAVRGAEPGGPERRVLRQHPREDRGAPAVRRRSFGPQRGRGRRRPRHRPGRRLRQQPDRPRRRAEPAPDPDDGRPLPDQLPDRLLPGVLLAGGARRRSSARSCGWSRRAGRAASTPSGWRSSRSSAAGCAASCWSWRSWG